MDDQEKARAPQPAPDAPHEENSPKNTASAPRTTSAFRNAMEAAAREQRAAELAERTRQAEAEDAAYQAREAYAKELNEEKVDLIRLKQGIISESDRVFPEQEAPKQYTPWQKIGNWFYHAKWWLGIATFCALIAAFLVYDYVTRIDPDVRLLMLSSNLPLYAQTQQLCEILEVDCPDYDGDGKSVVDVVYVPTTKEILEGGSSAATSYNTQLLVQFQSSMCMLVLADDAADECLSPDEMFVNLEELYPQYDFIEGYRVQLNDTPLLEWIAQAAAQAADAETTDADAPLTLNTGTYLALRAPHETMDDAEAMQAAYDRALPVLEGLLQRLAEGGASGA